MERRIASLLAKGKGFFQATLINRSISLLDRSAGILFFFSLDDKLKNGSGSLRIRFGYF